MIWARMLLLVGTPSSLTTQLLRSASTCPCVNSVQLPVILKSNCLSQSSRYSSRSAHPLIYVRAARHPCCSLWEDSGKGCKSRGYDEFEPDSWPSVCAPNKEDWIAVDSHECQQPDRTWGNLFWACTDITLVAGGNQFAGGK